MHVVATAGHVDHGKSTLVRALTGIDPDRWAEEHRRGMTIDLGFAWTTLPSGRTVAFVDVPGHERFITNMLAGVGAAPAVAVVVAADEGWMAQTQEHVEALVALGCVRVLLVITKCDLAPPGPAAADARTRLRALGIDDVAVVETSTVTGAGLDDLRLVLEEFLATQPAPDLDAPVRLWIDRVFTIRGSGTVVTGTLTQGRINVGDRLVVTPSGRTVDVRALQSMQQPCDSVAAQARVAVNLRGVDRDELARGMALATPDAWTLSALVDVVCAHDGLPDRVVVHAGSAAVPARLRRLGDRGARLALREPLPLHVGDRLLVRDPAARRVAGADVADLDPPAIRRRGDAGRMGAALAVPRSGSDLVAARGACRVADIVAAGLTPPVSGVRRVGQWCVRPDLWGQWRARLQERVRNASQDALSAGVPVAALVRDLDLPSPEIAVALLDELDDLHYVDGRVRWRSAPVVEIPALARLVERLAADPFAAPDAAELAELQLGPAELAHAVRSALLLRLTDGVYVAPDAPALAVRLLAALPETFTVSEARARLGSTRRVVVPLLEHLDATRRTRRLPDGRRVLVRPEA